MVDRWFAGTFTKEMLDLFLVCFLTRRAGIQAAGSLCSGGDVINWETMPGPVQHSATLKMLHPGEWVWMLDSEEDRRILKQLERELML